MAELKHTFVSGRMDKDRDERLVQNGSYRDALNIHVSSSEGSDAGAVENLLGNKKLSNLNLTNAKTLGSITYTLKDKIYWLVTSDNIDGIYEYDQKQNVILPILIDTKTTGKLSLKAASIEANIDNELTLDSVVESELRNLCGNLPLSNNAEVLVNRNLDLFCPDPYIKISIPKNTILRKENDKFVFKNIEYNDKDYGNIDLSFTYSSDGILNFSKNNLITGINIIDDMLFWTDNLNPPRKINLINFKKFSKGLFDTQTKVIYFEKDTNDNLVKKERDFTEEDLSVAKKAPMYAPTVELRDSLIDTDEVTEISKSISFFKNASIGASSGRGPLAVGDDLPEIVLNALPTWELNSEVLIEETNPADDKVGLSAIATVKSKNTINNSIVLTLKTKNIDFEDKNYEVIISLVESKPIYELSFVRFSYRWKYKDGEYSTIAPFSEVAFIPGAFKYDGKNAFNLGMENNLRKIILSNFDLGTDNVEEIEILFKETRNQNIYTLKSKKKIDFSNTYEITKKQIHSVLPNDQLLRAWDAVPRYAKAQEVTANRIVYGNYVQNYDIYNDPEFDIKITNRNDNFINSIKSDRTYQIGVVYIDEYNRHSPVISDQTGSVKITKDKAPLKNAFNISLKSNPPAWAKYFKYYVKDISQEYYNLAADKIYSDKDDEGFSYIAFPSTERNKITDDSYILLKKGHGSDDAIDSKNNRFKIIEIFNEAPDFVAFRKKLQTVFNDVVFDNDFGGDNSTTQTTKADGKTPSPNNLKILLESVNGSTEGINDDDKTFLKPGNFIKFVGDENKTKFYEISSVRYRINQTPPSDDVEITFKKPFEDDVNILYDSSDNVIDDISIEIYKTEGSKGDKEFDGKFFVKVIDTFDLLKDNSKNQLDGKEYATKEVLEVTGSVVLESGGLFNLNSAAFRFGNNAAKEPSFPIFIPEPTDDFDSTKYQISIEEATTAQSKEYIKLFKTGAKVILDDNKDVIYEIIASGEIQAFKKPKKKEPIRKKHIGFKDKDGNKPPINIFPSPNSDESIKIEFLQEVDDDDVSSPSNPAIFETEPIENVTDLDIYYETEKAYEISEHGNAHTLKWFNCFSFGNGVESNRIRDDFNATFIDVGVKASSVISEQIKEEHKFNGIIWSGIINSRSGVNKSNEFNIANPITKDLLPSYGSIQKLHAWDDSIVILCEDKILRALADKDILFNADGNPNVVATNRVIGAVQPYNGEYGISQNPESFAAYGFRCYFSDKARGAIIRLSKDGLTPIDKILMSDFFDERFFDTGCYNSTVDNSAFIGSYDNYNGLYNISFINRDTVCFDETINGWTTRKSFIPENAISLNNTYYTYNKGEIWEHDNKDIPYNNFYGTQYNSKIELEINDDPSVIKSYKTLGYEGTKSWTAKVITDQQKSSDIYFKEKENKYFAYVNGENKDITNIDAKNFNFQGIGKANTVSSVAAVSNTNLSFELSPKETEKYTSNTINIEKAPGSELDTTVDIILFPKNNYELDATSFDLVNATATQDGDNIKLSYTHGIKTQPTTNVAKIIPLCKINFAKKKKISVSGNYTLKLENVTSDVGDGSYTLSDNPNVIEVIKRRTITPDSGWFISPSDITVNNKLIKLTKAVNKNGSITITEKIVIPEVTTTDIDYEIKVIAREYLAPSKKIHSISIDKSNITNDNKNRTLTIFADEGSVFTYKLTDSSSELEREVDLVIPSGGSLDIDISFPFAETSETFTITVSPGEDTELDTNLSSTVTIVRNAISSKSITLFSQFKSNISNKNKIQGFVNTDIDSAFEQTISLPTGTYNILRQPLQSDFIFENNTDAITLTNLNIALDDTADEITLTGNINVSNITVDNKIVLILDSVVNDQVTLTIDYNTTILGGSATSNYTKTAPVSAFTIQGAAELLASAEREYLFTLTPTSGYEFINSINGADFEITDGSDVVTSTYALNDKMKVVLEDNLLKVGFITKPFNLPSANKTIYVRPKKQIAQAVVVSSNYSLTYIVNPSYYEDYLVDNGRILGPLTNAANQNFLFQKTFKVDREGRYFSAVFNDDISTHQITLLDTELSSATAGTYTDINGDSITVTGPIELNETKTELTVNTLANISSQPEKQLGRVRVRFSIRGAGAALKISLAEGGCDTKNTYQKGKYVWNTDGTADIPKIGARVTNTRQTKYGLTYGKSKLENKFKIFGSNKVITVIKDSPTGIDIIKDIEECPPPPTPTINFEDIIKTYGDPSFGLFGGSLGATSNGNGILTYTIADSSIATVQSGLVTIVGAGTTTITAAFSETSQFSAASKTVRLIVRKADPIITATDQIKYIADPNFTITIDQP